MSSCLNAFWQSSWFFIVQGRIDGVVAQKNTEKVVDENLFHAKGNERVTSVCQLAPLQWQRGVPHTLLDCGGIFR